MKIENHFERQNPKDNESRIIYRGLQFETYLKPECVKKIAQKHIPGHESDIMIIGVFVNETKVKVTRFRVNLEDAAYSSFPQFLYQVMNWEGNLMHWN